MIEIDQQGQCMLLIGFQAEFQLNQILTLHSHCIYWQTKLDISR